MFKQTGLVSSVKVIPEDESVKYTDESDEIYVKYMFPEVEIIVEGFTPTNQIYVYEEVLMKSVKK